MRRFNTLSEWYASQRINPYLIICLDNDGEVLYLEDHRTLQGAQKEMTRLWNGFYYDVDERNDWELEELPNGFTTGFHRFLLFSSVNHWRAAHE